MPRISRPLAALALVLPTSAPVWAADPAADLQDLRQQCVAAAETAQQDERALLKARHDTVLLDRDASATERGLKESRGEQAQLLAGLARLARNPPPEFGLAPEAPLDRIRTGMLVAATEPAFRRTAQALVGEYTRLAALRQDLASRQKEAAIQQANLKQDYASIAELTARRNAAQKLTGNDIAAISRGAALADVIKAIEAKKAADDPSRPKGLRVFDAAAAPSLHPPVAGPVVARFGTLESSDKLTDSLGFAPVPGAVAVAPFDGRVDFAGKLRDLGVVLIIAHGGGYHSVLAGLDRIDAKPGEWVLAGEPVGAMPDNAAAGSGTVLNFELRRDGVPVDPFPSLIDSGDETGHKEAGHNRVPE